MKKNILEKIIFITLIITFILDFLFNEKTDFQYENLLNITYLLTSSCLIYLACLNKDNYVKKNNFKYYFIFYLILIIYLSFNKNTHYNYSLYNLIPFKTILNANKELFKTLFFNFIVLIPLSIILPNMSDKLKSVKNYLITIIFISLSINGFGYIFHFSILDIDDILLNILGSIIAFYILKKDKINIFINKIIYDIKLKEMLRVTLFIILYLIFMLITMFKLIGSLVSIHANYYRDYSHLTCYDNNNTYITDKGNYHYYSKCNYKDSYVIVGNIKYSVRDYVNSFYFKETDLLKMNLIREKIIDNVKVIKKDNVIKRINNSRNYNKLYLVNIDEISLTKDKISHMINDNTINNIDLYSLVKFNLSKDYDNYGYILYKGEFYNIINVFKLEEDDYFEFIIPTDYKINKDNIIKLYKYASND